ncbi:MAG: YdcF family protein [Polyangiaceae bacterium]|nr:YdcF family protein [Polyangiaceae bacterium]
MVQWLSPSRRRSILRGAGVGAAAFVLLNLLSELTNKGSHSLRDWVSVPESKGLRCTLALIVATFLVLNCTRRFRSPCFRAAALLTFSAVSAAAVRDACLSWAAYHHGHLTWMFPLPASAFVAAFFAALAWDVARPDNAATSPFSLYSRGNLWLSSAAGLALIALLPVLRMVTFGASRYERSADVAVVLGARVWATGRPSLALADRVDEAVRLYHRGLVSRIVMSGAIDHAIGHSEPQVMRDRAIAMGVPAGAILLDEHGDNTALTARNTAAIMTSRGYKSALIVTHYYHQPRTKLLFEKRGIRVYTVPATMTRRLAKEPYFVAREVAAYYVALLKG